MSDLWIDLSELCGLPGMPSKISGLRRKAGREDWRSRDRAGRGGGKEYQVPDRYLTAEMIAALQGRSTITPLNKENQEFKPCAAVEASASQRDRSSEPAEGLLANPTQSIDLSPSSSVLSKILDKAEIDPTSLPVFARLEIVRIWQLYISKAATLGVKEIEATSQFCREIGDRAIQIPDWVRAGLEAKNGNLKLSRAALQIWKNKTASELQPRHKGRDGQDFFAQRPEYVIAVEAVAREFGATARHIFFAFTSGLIREDFGLTEMPSESQIARWVTNWKAENSQRARAFATGDKSILLSAQGSYSRGLRPNDKWEIDSTKADLTTKKTTYIWLASPYKETAVRCALVAAIDVATRMVKILLRPTSNSEAICLVMADCVRDWGLPKTIKTDNGKDYISKHVMGFCSALGIEQKLCVVRQPWEKPHIERFMRSLQHSVEWEALPWNTGHNVAQQQAYRKRRDGDKVLPWTIEEFQSWVDRWISAYHNRLHSGLGCSPLERLAAFRSDGFMALMPRRLEENLAFALLREDLVTVGKPGISYLGRNYIASELLGRVGEKLAIRIDPSDPNQIVIYTSKDLQVAEIVCVARWDMAMTPEEQARIASVKPAIDQARAEHEDAVKKAQRKLKNSIAKNPEGLLPERGGVAAYRATQEIGLAAEKLIESIDAAISNQPQLSAAKRDELGEIRRQIEAKDKLVSIATDYDELLRKVVKAWQEQQPISDEDLLEAAHYCERPEGQGVLICFLESGDYRMFLRWIANKKATLQVAI